MGQIITYFFDKNKIIEIKNLQERLTLASNSIDKQIENLGQDTDDTINPIIRIKDKLISDITQIKNKFESLRSTINTYISFTGSSVMCHTDYLKDAIKEGKKLDKFMEKIKELERVQKLIRKLFQKLSNSKEYELIEKYASYDKIIKEDLEFLDCEENLKQLRNSDHVNKNKFLNRKRDIERLDEEDELINLKHPRFDDQFENTFN
jgi:hypothetical protein